MRTVKSLEQYNVGLYKKESLNYYFPIIKYKIKYGKLVENTKINSFIYKSHTYIDFYRNGNIEKGYLAEDTKIDGFIYNLVNV